MSLDAKILGLDQKVDFSDGSISNVVRIELPNGAQVVALVTDEGAQHVFAAVQAARGVFKERAAAPAPPRVVYAPRPAAAGPEPFEFGGNGAAPIEDESEEGGEEDEPVVPPQFAPPLARVRIPSADEKGNPVDATGTPLYVVGVAAQAGWWLQEDAALDEDGVRGL